MFFLRFFVLVGALLFLSSCTITRARQVLAVVLKPKGEKVEILEKGDGKIFSLIPTGQDPNAIRTLNDLRELNGCKTLANIDMIYFDKTYLVWSVPSLRVRADCVRE